MTTAAALPTEHASYLNETKGLRSWLTTTDAKRIGVLYLVSMGVFVFVGIVFALLMRLELMSPGTQFLTPEAYNRVMTLHGVIMVFLFIIPSIPAVFGNFVLPMMIGANDVFFPRLNLASWYFYIAGGLLGVISMAFFGPDTGWTFYVPYSVVSDSSGASTPRRGSRSPRRPSSASR